MSESIQRSPSPTDSSPETDAKELTPAQEFAEATRRGVPPVVWALFFLCEYVLSIALLGLVAVVLIGWYSETAHKWAWFGGATLAAVGVPFGLVRIQFYKPDGGKGMPP